MLRRMMKDLKKQEGFTLLEVLVVIAILGIIAALITPRFLNVMRDARVDTVRASAKQIQMALERENFTANHYPASAAIENYGEMQTVLGNSVALEANPPFTFVSYTSTTPFHDYTMILTVNNAATDAGTERCVQITPAAITTGTLTGTAGSYTCP